MMFYEYKLRVKIYQMVFGTIYFLGKGVVHVLVSKPKHRVPRCLHTIFRDIITSCLRQNKAQAVLDPRSRT